MPAVQPHFVVTTAAEMVVVAIPLARLKTPAQSKKNGFLSSLLGFGSKFTLFFKKMRVNLSLLLIKKK
jgi:hypothetical protein